MDQIIASGGKKEARTKAPVAASESMTKIRLFRKKLETLYGDHVHLGKDNVDTDLQGSNRTGLV